MCCNVFSTLHWLNENSPGCAQWCRSSRRPKGMTLPRRSLGRPGKLVSWQLTGRAVKEEVFNNRKGKGGQKKGRKQGKAPESREAKGQGKIERLLEKRGKTKEKKEREGERKREKEKQKERETETKRNKKRERDTKTKRKKERMRNKKKDWTKEMIWYDMKWYEMMWNEMKWNETKLNEMMWNDTKWNKAKWKCCWNSVGQTLTDVTMIAVNSSEYRHSFVFPPWKSTTGRDPPNTLQGQSDTDTKIYISYLQAWVSNMFNGGTLRDHIELYNCFYYLWAPFALWYFAQKMGSTSMSFRPRSSKILQLVVQWKKALETSESSGFRTNTCFCLRWFFIFHFLNSFLICWGWFVPGGLSKSKNIFYLFSSK